MKMKSLIICWKNCRERQLLQTVIMIKGRLIKVKKILIPVDFSENTGKIIEEGKSMAQAFDSDIVLLYVINENIGQYYYNILSRNEALIEKVMENERKQAEEEMEKWSIFLGDLKGTVETVVKSGSVINEILKQINDTDVDFVIMGSHGIGSVLYRTFIGSTANYVLHHSEKPVLIIKC